MRSTLFCFTGVHKPSECTISVPAWLLLPNKSRRGACSAGYKAALRAATGNSHLTKQTPSPIAAAAAAALRLCLAPAVRTACTPTGPGCSRSCRARSPQPWLCWSTPATQQVRLSSSGALSSMDCRHCLPRLVLSLLDCSSLALVLSPSALRPSGGGALGSSLGLSAVYSSQGTSRHLQ